MTALVLAGAGAPGADLPLGTGTVQDAVVAQLHRLGAGPVDVLGSDGDTATALGSVAAALDGATGAVALVSADLVIADDALADLLLDPRRRSAALVGGVPAEGGAAAAVRRGPGGRVRAAGSAHHAVTSPDGTFAGALVVGPEDAPAAARAVREMAAVASAERWGGDVLALVLVAMVRRGVPPVSVVVDPWPWWRPGTARQVDEATAVLADLDPRRVRLARALRPDDGFYSTFVVRRLSRRLTPVALRSGLRPNQITLASLGIGLLAALAFAAGGRAGLVTGALLLQVSLVVDCVDGEVARFTRAFSSTGAWLDASTDRVKEYACYAGLAVGAEPGSSRLWLLAAAMLALQTARHTSDYTYAMVRDAREYVVPDLDLRRRDDAAPAGGTTTAERVVEAGRRSNRSAAVRWAKKAALLPIGERWLVISVTAAAGGPELVFVSLLVLAVVAAGYATVTRLVRARTWTDRTADDRVREVVGRQVDAGPLAALAGRAGRWRAPVGRTAWLLPALARLAEYGTLLAVVRAVAPDALPLAFALLLAVSYSHYDLTYRLLHDLPPAGALRLAGLGADGRLAVVALLAAAGPRPLETGLAVLAVAGTVLFGVSGTLGTLVRASGARRPVA